MSLGRLISACRQWTFPPSLRIRPPADAAWDETLAAAISEVRAQTQQLERRVAVAATRPTAPVGGGADPAGPAPAAAIDQGLAVDLCNENFRLRRNMALLRLKLPESGELDRMGRVLDNLEQLLKDRKVECVDPTGQAYDVGRADFEPMGKQEEKPGLVRATISRCERPVIVVDGRIVQKARGLVARPAKPNASEN